MFGTTNVMIIPKCARDCHLGATNQKLNNMPKIRKDIRVPHGAIKKLAEQFGCSDKYVSHCLRGMYDTERAETIRTAARKL